MIKWSAGYCLQLQYHILKKNFSLKATLRYFDYSKNKAKRLCIEVVRGNDSRIFGTYDTRKQGQEVGKSYSIALAGYGGVVALIYADFDENNKLTSNDCRVFEVWDIPKN